MLEAESFLWVKSCCDYVTAAEMIFFLVERPSFRLNTDLDSLRYEISPRLIGSRVYGESYSSYSVSLSVVSSILPSSARNLLDYSFWIDLSRSSSLSSFRILLYAFLAVFICFCWTLSEGKSKFFLKILSSIPKENYSPISCGYLGISILEFKSEYEDVTFGRML